MHHLRLNIRLITVAFAAVVIALAASSFGTPRQASAYSDPSGVICGYLFDLELNTAPLPFSGTVLARIDLDFIPKGNPNDVAVTAVAYTHATKAMPDCKTLQELPPASVPPPDVIVETRPSVLAKFDGVKTIAGTSCQEDFVFAGFPLADWTRITVSFTISQSPSTTQFPGSFNFVNKFANEANCLAGAPLAVGGLGNIDVSFSSLYLDGPDEAVGAFNSDWDKDGCLDWNELALFAQYDPFDPDDCKDAGAVGGVAEIVDGGGPPLDAAESAGGSSWLIAIVASAAVVGTLTLGGALVYARRRTSR